MLLIVENHHIVRQGLIALLNTAPDMEVVAEASDGQGADLSKHQPDVTLMDWRLPSWAVRKRWRKSG